ncbi:uncharacterized protein LOC126900033 [Daktulosphaira vitifoliae]|uniref:uncharacterized protein LOC126900033 n=1 Tax=Daktulosphaira vitifoliae TaxID=58002 RepID=UPI0021AABD10|nr:uncharacterized protein LOC126900033 [Daktulosphaira vitifoliae]
MKMNLKYYFSVSILWSLKYILTLNASDTELKLYLVEVVNHIIYHDQFKDKTDSWNNLNTTDDSIFLLNTSSKKMINDLNITPQIFSSIIVSINYRYAKFLKIYNSYVMIIISECENYYNKKIFNKFIECTNIIHNVIGCSNGMFEILNDILMFINILDVNTIFPEYVLPYTVVNEINTVHVFTAITKPCTFTYKKSNGAFDTDDACEYLLSIKHFHTEVTHMLENISCLDKISHINNNFIYKYILEKYNQKYALQKEIDKSFVEFICDDVKVFYKETIKNENENLGFQELLNQTLPGLVPPLKVVDTEHRIAALNKLYAKRYFEPFKNIKIILENFLKIDASILFQNEVNSFNLQQNEKYFEQLLWCRYIEIFKKYEIFLTIIISHCRFEELKGTIYNKQYVECINQLRSSVSFSVSMIKLLLSAMAILKKLYIWKYHESNHNCMNKLANIVTELFYDLKALNIGPYENTNTVNEIIAKAYLDQLSETHEKLKNGLHSEMGSRLRFRCEYFENFTDTAIFYRSYSNLKFSTKHDGPLYKLICLHINRFCNEIIENDYKNLGFNDLI